jgi:hypothetical protein
MLAAASSVLGTFAVTAVIIVSQLPSDTPAPPIQDQGYSLVVTPTDITTLFTTPPTPHHTPEQEIADATPLAIYYPQPVEPELCDGLGHCWRYGAWRYADDRLYIEPEPEPEYTYTTSTPTYYYGDGVEQWRGLVSEIFPSYVVDYVLAIMQCESGGDPNETGSQGEMGLLQIHPDFHPDATYDPRGNIMAAYRISSGGTDFSAWSCA